MIDLLIFWLCGLAVRRQWQWLIVWTTRWYVRRHPLWRKCAQEGCWVCMWPAHRSPARCPAHSNVN